MKSKFSFLTTAAAAILLSLPLGTIAKEPEHADAPKVSPADALARLKAGNQRFVAGKLQHPHQDSKRRAELAKGQQPFAIVLGCADSRTSPEVLFDQGLGDLFVVRVAGNVLDDHALASIEYAVEHLGAQLIVVLGHQRCGAVQAAKDTVRATGLRDAAVVGVPVAEEHAGDAAQGGAGGRHGAGHRLDARVEQHHAVAVAHEVDVHRLAREAAAHDPDAVGHRLGAGRHAGLEARGHVEGLAGQGDTGYIPQAQYTAARGPPARPQPDAVLTIGSLGLKSAMLTE